MLQNLLFLLLNSIFTFKIVTSISQLIGKSDKKMRQITCLILFLIFFILHYLYFALNKTENYFEIMGLNRNYQESEFKVNYKQNLVKYHTDKISGDTEKFLEIKLIQQIFQDQKLKGTYNSFGNFKIPQEKVAQDFYESLYFINHYQQYFFYAITVLLMIVTTYDDNLKKSRQFCLTVISIFFMYDFCFMHDYYVYVEKFDFFVFILPSYALFELCQILRLFVSLFITFGRCWTCITDESSIIVINVLLDREIKKYEGILQNIKQNKDQFVQDDKQLVITGMQKAFAMNIENQQKQKEGIANKIRKIVEKFLSILMTCLTLYSIFNMFMPSFGQNSEK